ncbi:hypothetical protein LINGRAHAP2_LOCUS6932 [Linum grandiflorum]
MYPIVWAVVENENRSSWTWFISILQKELGFADGTRWSVISDQHKGLVESLKEVMPLAEHRKCARHVSANWKVKHKTAAARKAFWMAVYSSNTPDFQVHLAELKRLQESGIDPGCYTDFLSQDPKTFCRAFLSRVPKSDSVESNICETFNACVVRFRCLRIINMLEGIRGYMMTHVVNKVKLFQTTTHRSICPRIAAKIEKCKAIARDCRYKQTVGLICECHLGDKGYVVDLHSHTCSCGYWELSGIPCVHAIGVAGYLRKEIYYWVNEYYTLNMAEKAYAYGGIPAMPGQQVWEEASGLVIRPPIARVMPGRPKKNRRKEAQELQVRSVKKGSGTALSKHGVVMHYKECKQAGHNNRQCRMRTQPAAATSERPCRPRAKAPAVPHPRSRKIVCGICAQSGHNGRTCSIRVGVQVRLFRLFPFPFYSTKCHGYDGPFILCRLLLTKEQSDRCETGRCVM